MISTRERGIRFIAAAIAAVIAAACGGGAAGETSEGQTPPPGRGTTAPLALEKAQLKLGFIKLTDMVPLAIAYEKGYFEDEGLFVTLEPQANWKVLLDRVIDGELDGAHMLAGQPLAATIGFGTKADVVTAFSMDLNGNATTVSNDVWSQMQPHLAKDAQGRPVHPIAADSLAPVVSAFRAAGRPFRMAMVFPVSTHNYELRYWLAAGGLHPGFYSPTDVSGQIEADVQLSVTPLPQMPATLEAGTIHGYSVGEPWNQQAIVRGIVIANSMTGTFEYGKGDIRSLPDFNVFFRYFATYPYYSDAVWYLTQMRRWGQIPEAKPDAWYREVAARVYLPGIYLRAATELVAEGKALSEAFPFGTDGYRPPTAEFIDGVEYDGRQPNAYLEKFPIGLKGNQIVGDEGS